MDVAASHLSTKQMGPAGPTSEKAAKQMKNVVIFVAKRTKNWAWEAREVQRVLSFFFPPSGLLLLHHAWPLKQPLKHSKHKVKKKKTQLSREDHVSSKVGFLKFCYLLFLANNYETVILNIETFSVKQCCCHCWLSLSLSLSLKQSHHLE
jgi:hypothetical protein